MYGRLIWIATNEMPKIRKMRRVARSVRTPRSDAKARSTIRPVGTTSGRTSFEPKVTSSAVPTDSSAESAKTAGERPAEPVDEDARRGPGRRRTRPAPTRRRGRSSSRAGGAASRRGSPPA